jgi:hypothetical protein
MIRLNQDIVYAMNRFRPPIRDIRKRVERYGVVGASPDNYSRRTLWSNLIREYEIESKASHVVRPILDSMPGRSDSW